jgi:hypothetical protein
MSLFRVNCFGSFQENLRYTLPNLLIQRGPMSKQSESININQIIDDTMLHQVESL